MPLAGTPLPFVKRGPINLSVKFNGMAATAKPKLLMVSVLGPDPPIRTASFRGVLGAAYCACCQFVISPWLFSCRGMIAAV